MENSILLHLILGPLMLGLSLLYKAFPPKNINFLYGYRTSRSMKSAYAWTMANKWSADLMVSVSLITCVAQGVFYAAGMSLGSNVGWSSGILVVLLLGHIPVIEIRLRKNFDSQGQPLSR